MKKEQTPSGTVSIKLAFASEKDAHHAQEVLIQAVEKKFKGIQYAMLPAYNPEDVGFKFPKKVAKKHKRKT